MDKCHNLLMVTEGESIFIQQNITSFSNLSTYNIKHLNYSKNKEYKKLINTFIHD